MISERRILDYSQLHGDVFLERVAVALHMYADESGTHDETGMLPGSEVAVVAGYIAEQDQWSTFWGQWRQALDEYGIPVFHASDLLGPRGLCLDPKWPQQRIDAFVNRLITIARENTFFAVGGLLAVRHYHTIVSEDMKKIIGHPYYFSFQLFLDTTLKVLNKDIEDPLRFGEEVAFFFDNLDDQQEFKHTVMRLYDFFKARRDVNRNLGPIGFLPKERYLPLQAADLLAWRLRKILTRKIAGGVVIQAGGWDAKLIEDRNVVTAYYVDENLPLGLAEMKRAHGYG